MSAPRAAVLSAEVALLAASISGSSALSPAVSSGFNSRGRAAGGGRLEAEDLARHYELDGIDPVIYERRHLILATMCLSLVLITLVGAAVRFACDAVDEGLTALVGEGAQPVDEPAHRFDAANAVLVGRTAGGPAPTPAPSGRPCGTSR